jgi:conjugative transposon TraK protein
MLNSLKSVESAYQRIKLITIVFMVFCITVVGIVVYRTSVFEDKLLNRMDKPYLLVGNNVYEIEMARNLHETRPIEAVGHVERFHELYFNLDPDEKVIESNIKQAMYMVDESGMIQYEHQKNNRYFAQLIAGSISQRISLNGLVQLDTINSRPHFKVDAYQYLTRRTSIVKRSLITEGYLRGVEKTANNPFGFVIEDWKIVTNQDIEVVERN